MRHCIAPHSAVELVRGAEGLKDDVALWPPLAREQRRGAWDGDMGSAARGCSDVDSAVQWAYVGSV